MHSNCSNVKKLKLDLDLGPNLLWCLGQRTQFVEINVDLIETLIFLGEIDCETRWVREF